MDCRQLEWMEEVGMDVPYEIGKEANSVLYQAVLLQAIASFECCSKLATAAATTVSGV